MRRAPALSDHAPPELLPAWEAAFGEYLGVSPGVAVGSGRQGMALLLRYLRLQPGDEVIIPAYTLRGLLPLISASGAVPVPADIDSATMVVSAATVASRISAKTRAIMVLHAFGVPCAMRELTALAAERDIPVIEDCAHALGATLDGVPVGTAGWASFFSFDVTKPLHTYGGGMVVSADCDLLAWLRQQVAGYRPYPDIVRKKINALRTEQRLFATGLARLPLGLATLPVGKQLVAWLYRMRQQVPPPDSAYLPVQARIGLDKLPGLVDRLAARNVTMQRYRTGLDSRVQLQQVTPGTMPGWYFAVALMPSPVEPLRRRLFWRGIDAGSGDEVMDDCARLLGYDDCPITADISGRALALPFYDGMPVTETAAVCDAVNMLMR